MSIPEEPFSATDDDVVAYLLDPSVALTESDAARMFANKFSGRLAYCHTEGVWREWSGSIWAKCELPTGFIRARQEIEEMAPKVKSGGQMKKLRYVQAMVTFTQNDERIARRATDWDQDDWLLGTPTGTVDLKTGKTLVAKPSFNITKTTAVAPAAMSLCPAWRRFLLETTAGDEDLIRYLQQIAGYSLTGSTREQSLFFIYGPGGNGKGVFLHTIANIMGDYATNAATQTFMATNWDRHTTDLAMLRGARLVTASETPEGSKWDQQRVTSLTGGDKITARFMHKNNFEFIPQFTLVIVGNHKPELRSVDDAIRRRMNMIPFEIRPKLKDAELEDKLRPEWPGILRWMIEGCLDWQADGLVRPTTVSEMTDAYFYDENTLQQWLDQECEVEPDNPHLCEKSSALFQSWVHFCKANEETPGSAKTFKPAMQKAGFRFKRTAGGKWFHGVSLRHIDTDRGAFG
jgi:putative DNA primase/helicase